LAAIMMSRARPKAYVARERSPACAAGQIQPEYPSAVAIASFSRLFTPGLVRHGWFLDPVE